MPACKGMRWDCGGLWGLVSEEDAFGCIVGIVESLLHGLVEDLLRGSRAPGFDHLLPDTTKLPWRCNHAMTDLWHNLTHSLNTHRH